MQLKIDEEFKEFKEDVRNGKYTSPLHIPTSIWQNSSWEMLDKKELEEVLLPFLRFSLDREINKIPVYKNAYKNLPKINSFEDFSSVPILVKDSTSSEVGFRDKILTDPYILLPDPD